MQKKNARTLTDNRAVFEWKNAHRHCHTIGKYARLLPARFCRSIENQDAVFATACVKLLGGPGSFVGVEWVFGGGVCPQPAGLVEVESDNLVDVRIGGDQFNLKTGRQREGGLLFFGRQR